MAAERSPFFVNTDNNTLSNHMSEQKKKNGRPTKYSPALVANLCDLIIAGLSHNKAARVLSISLDSISRWQKEYADFAAALARAEVGGKQQWSGKRRCAYN
jgi:hypothetical protein